MPKPPIYSAIVAALFSTSTALAAFAAIAAAPAATAPKKSPATQSAPASPEALAWQPAAVSLAPAKWIWLPSQRTLPNSFVLFRRELDLAEVPSRAFAWLTADSRYLLTVNGRRVQWGPAPCDPRQLDVDPADLRPYLRPGKNVIGIQVLFYGHGDGTWPGGRPGLLFRLDLETARGPQQLVSDASWLALLDRAHRPGQHKRWFLRALQEEFDARLHPQGWDTPAFSPDARWSAAQVLDCAPDKPPSTRRDRHWSADSVDRIAPALAALRARQIPPAAESLVPARGLVHSGLVRWKRPPEDWFDVRMPDAFEVSRTEAAAPDGPGRWRLPATAAPDQGVQVTFDFAEQAVGFPRFVIDAPAGTVVELMTQEAHDPAATRWLDSHFFAWSRFVCREGRNEFELFDYESFRWLQLHVRGASRPVVISEVGMRRRQYAWPVEPRLRTSDAVLQRLFDAGFNTLRNSVLDTIVDGMGRERQQYSGDGGHQLHAIRYAFGDPRICARYLRTFSEGLTKSGYFMDSYPAYDRLARLPQRELDAAYWGPLLDHGIGFVFDNWNHHLETGDTAALREPFPRLLRFADYLWSIRDPRGLLPVEDLGIPNVWMDHDAYRNQRNRQCAFNLYAAAMYRHALAPVADALGDARAAALARERGDALLAATVARFWSREHRVFLDNLPWLAEDRAPRLSDRALATALLFDQCPDGNTAAALRALVELPQNMGLSYPCNAGWRYWALARHGRADVALADLRRRWATMPSVRDNNTLQEVWQAKPDGVMQWSHSALAPIFVLYQDIVGLRPLEPGFRRLQLRPQLGDLPDLEATAHTPRGPVHFRSRLEGGAHAVEVVLPADCEAELVLPGEGGALRRTRLPAGASRFTVPAR